MNKHKLKYILHLLIILLLSSCSKDLSIISIDDDINNINISKDTLFFDINLSAYVESYQSITRSSSDTTLEILPNAIIHIYAYKQYETPDENKCFAKSVYQSRKTGKINPIHDNLKLNKGIYNFYMLSVFNSTHDRVPDFDPLNGKSSAVYNGVDYLWGMISNFEIKDDIKNILEFKLKRCCLSIEFNFEFNNSNYNKLYSAEIEAGDASQCAWSIATGIINPAANSNEIYRLNTDSCSAKAILLPFESTIPSKLSFVVTNSQLEMKEYTLDISPHFGNVFHWGYNFVYKIIIDNNNAYISKNNTIS